MVKQATAKDKQELLTLAQASKVYEKHRRRLGISHPNIAAGTLRLYCGAGKVKCRKYGKTWFMLREDIEAFAESNLGPGPGGVPRERQKVKR